jgi:hypothetical protein
MTPGVYAISVSAGLFNGPAVRPDAALGWPRSVQSMGLYASRQFLPATSAFQRINPEEDSHDD